MFMRGKEPLNMIIEREENMDNISITNINGDPVNYLYQWDANQKVIITGLNVAGEVNVHFCNIDSEFALITRAEVTADSISAEVPNVLLQKPKPVVLYVYNTNASTGERTVYMSRITIIPRPRPADYIYTETETLHYSALDERILALEKALENSADKTSSGLHVGPEPPEDPNAGLWLDTDEESGDMPEQETGNDGFSPIVNVTETDTGAVISITDKDGTTEVTITNGKDGADGQPGKDGYTPQKGIDYFDGQPGKDGVDGKDGSPGADGYTPVKGKDYFDGEDGQDGSPGKDGSDGVSATHSWNGTILTVTSASGTSSADLKGEPGKDGNPGKDGSAGKDGTSVTVKSVSESTADGGSNVVTFSDGKTLTVMNGKTGAAGKNGADGKTPVKGTDYFTADDKAEMVEAVKDAHSSDISWIEGYEIPKLYLTGDTTGMSKDVAVTLSWVYGEDSGSCTLKWQGSSSIAWAKKNYTIKLDNAIDIGYGAQKKYCLKANYIDFSHARNIVSARIWGMMVASRKNVIGKLTDSPNYGAVNGFPVAIVLNGEFHGLYTFNIPKDGWMMNMGSGTQECILCADHSTATQFKGEATLVGETDFEIEYITDENNTAWAKTSVNRLINACINSNGDDLDTTIAQYLDWESAIDYYILVALLDGQDMLDKNYILATYDGVKWFFSAYDMDTSYGLKWDGSYFSKASYGDQTSFAAYATKHRLMELIKRFKTNALKARYAELRAGVLSESTIAREFERFACGIPSRLLDEDRNVWPMLPLTSVNNTFQILCWLSRRLPFVDKWMNELPAQEEVVGPSYTNQVPISTNGSGAVYNGTGYRDGYRLTDDWADKAAEGYTATGLIPCTGNDIIRIKGVEWPQSDDVGCYVSLYDADKTMLVRVRANNTAVWLTPTYDNSTGIITMCLSGNVNASKMAYVRFSCLGNGANMIVTINEEIT